MTAETTMGKAKKLRSTSHKKQVPPTGGATIAETESAREEALTRGEETQLFKGLVALEGSIREATCVTLATMFGDASDEESEKKNRVRLQKMVNAGLLKKLIPRMVDPLKMVRLHAVGAMRNISVTGGIDICEEMTANNVITPLIKIITEHATQETLEKNDLHAAQLLEQAVALLTNLCESCQAAINELTRGNLLPPIMIIAQYGRTHAVLHLETLRLLLSITEDNAKLNDVFGSNAAYQTILGETITSEQVALYTKLHAVGIAMNIPAIMAVEDNIARLLPVLQSALAYDPVNAVQMAQQAAESWGLSLKTFEETEVMEEDGLTEEKEQQIVAAQGKTRVWRESVQTLMLALELVAELAATGDDADDEEEWGSDDEDAMEEYAAAQMDSDSQSTASGTPAAKALAASTILQQCVAILQGLVSIPPLSVKSIAHDFERMRIRVCNAINNLVQCLPVASLGDNLLPQLFRHFSTLYNNIKNESSNKTFDFENATSTNDIEAATTSAMWSVLRRATAEKQDLPIVAEEANLIMSGALQSPSMETRMNAIGMIGCVGRRSKNPSENEVVGRCLLQSLNDSNLEVVAEALNALFDVYGDEDFDNIFRNLNLLSALEATSTAVKAKLRAEQRQMDRDVVAHIKETHLNLVRFIKYKKKHL
ncbi:TPA: hypothetical protein N0F65_001223 [Lagenidium giganteum]|uniref:SYO1-like TPR repeats domain-containing protein n=1 Tax=Lagenidium giganteum TaxID=4803 RepID=A0AAV2Z4S8_9STRA|nr:TPA: hypothetical protein N0F65_001223 [Lagenidium giganteum]